MIALPPGALKALKGNSDGIVFVLLALLSAGAGVVQPWFGFAMLLVGGILYNIRRSSEERHIREMGRQKLEEAALTVEQVKAQYRALPKQRRSLPPVGRENGVSSVKEVRTDD